MREPGVSEEFEAEKRLGILARKQFKIYLQEFIRKRQKIWNELYSFQTGMLMKIYEDSSDLQFMQRRLRIFLSDKTSARKNRGKV